MISNADMINCKLKDVAQLRGYKNAKHLTDAMSEVFGRRISYSTIYPLWDNTAANYARATLDRLCRFLNISLGVLIEYTPDVEPQADNTQQSPTAKSESKSAKKRGAKTGKA
jgi:DNA-binding Xre family transcriptional regulator